MKASLIPEKCIACGLCQTYSPSLIMMTKVLLGSDSDQLNQIIEIALRL